MSERITLSNMTWDEIEHAAVIGGRCVVRYGKQTNDAEEATVIRFDFDMKSMTRKVFVRFDDGVEIDYFMRDIYRISASA